MLSDLNYSVRTLLRSPLFALSAIVTLALGIGANTAVFSVVEAVLLRPLPYGDPDRLVRIWEANPLLGTDRDGVSPGSMVDWRTRSRTLERVALFMPRDWLVSMNGEVETIHAATVSPSLFPMLGVSPTMGRTFRAEQDQPPPFGDQDEIVISHSLWQRGYGGRPDILGQTLVVEGRTSMTIIGVMPAGFSFPDSVEAWRQQVYLRPVGPRERTTRYSEGLGQMKPGVTLSEARADLGSLAKQLEIEQPLSNKGYGVLIESLADTIVEGARTRLIVLLALVSCVLLIACANVASLLLARATARRHEVAVRMALGAHWTRVLRQSFADSLVLTTAGMLVGCALGLGCVRTLVALAPAGIPRLGEIAFGGPVLLFSAAIALASALLTSLPPVLQARKLDVHDTLKTGGRGAATSSARSLRGWLIGSEVALTLVLLIGSMLLLRSFVALRGVDVGFKSGQILTAKLRLPVNRFPETGRRPWFRLAQRHDEILADIQAIPGVVSVGGITDMPMTGEASTENFWFGGNKDAMPEATRQLTAALFMITPHYLDTMHVPLRRGRMFADADRFGEETLTKPAESRENKPYGVALVNEAFVRRYLPNSEPLGQSIAIFNHWAAGASTIVGVVGDMRSADVATPAAPAIFVPFGEVPGFQLSLAIRTSGAPESVTAIVRDRIHRIDPQMMVTNFRAMDAVVSGSLSKPRFTLLLVMSFALIALGLAAIGIYGIVAFLVANRTREIGVRIAIGARSSDIMKLVLRDGLVPVLIGCVAGCGLALMGVEALRSLLFGIPPLDPLSFALAAVALASVALSAALIPAKRATEVDPIVALRQE